MNKIICAICKKPIGDMEIAIQIRSGSIDNNEFEPESDIGYYHSDCLPSLDRQNYGDTIRDHQYEHCCGCFYYLHDGRMKCNECGKILTENDVNEEKEMKLK